MAMKTIGLVGGMTPESTRVYYDLLIQGARQPGRDPLRNPEIVIFSLNLTEVVQRQREGTRADVVHYLAAILERLGAAGAEVGALAANTPHAYLDEIRAATSLPLVRIVTATRDAAQNLELKRALLLGTRMTMESEMYPREFAEAGIEIVVPGDDDREFLDEVIYGELALGTVRPEVRQRCLKICERHVGNDGIDSVILGCTELPLVISSDDLSIAVFDTTVVHVEANLAAAS
ncbi:MAG: amino acid racemase [Acidobacteriota bacterium]|nr:amino acid racemase [Acidobacteriota bacterium]